MTEEIGQAEQDGYDPAAIEVLRGIKPRRPWQLLLEGHGLAAADADLAAGLERILELMPSVPALRVETAQGTLVAMRDFASNYLTEVNAILAGLFSRNSDLAGIQFPGEETGPAHTATPDNPFWSPRGMPSARIMAAMSRGDITPQDAVDQLNQLYRQS